MFRLTTLATAVLPAAATFLAVTTLSAPPAAPAPARAPAAVAPKTQPANPGDGMGQMLFAGLKSVEGCLGVDAGEMMSGHQSIFAWFEDKAAARRWYDHPVHQRMMAMMGGDDLPADHVPMKHVPDDTPILVIASITPPSDKAPQLPGSPIPISQISVEMFAPLAGGVAVNGRLAPDKFRVPHMDVINIPAAIEGGEDVGADGSVETKQVAPGRYGAGG